MTLPIGAQAIEENRLKRQLAPAGPVVVSLIGPLPRAPAGAMVIADPERAYRWDWIRGLEAHVWVRKGVQARATLIAILRARPSFRFERFAKCGSVEGLMLWDADIDRGMLIEPAWPEAFERALAALAELNDHGAWQRVATARYQHPGMTLRGEPLDSAQNSQYAKKIRWMKTA